MGRNRRPYWMNLISKFTNPLCLFADDPEGGGAAPESTKTEGEPVIEPAKPEPAPEPKKPDNSGAEHMIPKYRFDEVNNEKKEYKKEAQEAKEEAKRLKAELEQAKQTATPGSAFPTFDDPDTQTFYDNHVKPVREELKTTTLELNRMKQAEELEKRERAEAVKAEINAEMDDLQGKYAIDEDEKETILRKYSKDKTATLAEVTDKFCKNRDAKADVIAKKRYEAYIAGKVKDGDVASSPMPAGGAPASGALQCPQEVIKQGTDAIFTWHEKNIKLPGER